LQYYFNVIVYKVSKIVAMDSADERASPESRPIHLVNDVIYKINISSSLNKSADKWYGWPTKCNPYHT